jgi:diacylglycerol diphosphate phosphatase / phosphatidate phosphatase
MNAKLKVIGDHSSHYWAFVVTIIPLVLASILSAEMYLTHVCTHIPKCLRSPADSILIQQHHMRDIYAGMVLGIVIGALAYRSVYAALFDSCFNHIPLPPFSAKTRFSYSRDRKRELADGTNQHDEEVDKLVVWRWWKSRPSEQSREKEEIWLQNIRSMRAANHERGLPSEAILPQNQGDIFTMQIIEERVRAASTSQILSPSSPRACCV